MKARQCNPVSCHAIGSITERRVYDVYDVHLAVTEHGTISKV